MKLRPPSVLTDVLRVTPLVYSLLLVSVRVRWIGIQSLSRACFVYIGRFVTIQCFSANFRNVLVEIHFRTISIQHIVIVVNFHKSLKNMCKQFRLFLSSGLLLVLFSSLVTATTSEESFETVHTSNAAVLNRLGLTPLEIPDGHHKKRLAGPEPPGLSSQTRIHQPYSRRHGHRDSHVYIVKLPASPPYYTITKPHKSVNDDKVTKTGPSFPVGFQGNGKPAKIYHWNLPVVKKITEKKRLQLSQLRIDQTRKKQDDMKKQQQTFAAKTILNKLYPLDTSSKSYSANDNQFHSHQKLLVTKHVRNNDKRLSYLNNDNDNIKFKLTKKNDAGNKAYRLDDVNVHRIHLTNELHGSRHTVPKMKKHRKKAATSYYAPIATKTGSTSIHKNFPGNGKPKAFYIMEKSRKPVYYHPLLP